MEPVRRCCLGDTDGQIGIERAGNRWRGWPWLVALLGCFAPYFGSQAPAPLVGTQSPDYKGGPISGIETPNRSTIVFHMTEPGATFLIQALSLPLSAPVPESFAESLDKHNPPPTARPSSSPRGHMVKSNSSGRIAGVGYETGKSATLVRNPNWTASTDYRAAYLNQIDIKLGGSPTVIGEQVLKGSDAVELDPPAQAIVEQADASYPSQITFTVGDGGDNYMALNNAYGPLKSECTPSDLGGT